MTIDDLIRYVAGFDPSFPGRVEGAPPDEVERFAGLVRRLTGKELPGTVREYLLRMGQSDGGLRPIEDYPDMSVEGLIEVYEDVENDGATEDSFPPNCIVIGYDGVNLPEMSVEIVHGSDASPRVLATSGPRITAEVAESLENHLHHRAFSKYRMEPLPHSASFHPADKHAPLEAFAEAAEAIGIVREAFADRDVFCGARGDVYVAFYGAFRQFPYAVFASTDAKALDEVVEAFQAELPLELVTKV